MDPTCAVRHITLVLIAATIATAAAGCSQGQAAAIYPKADLSPPALLQAGPVDSRRVVVRFDEVVAPVVGSFASEPSADLTCLSEGANLTVSFEAGQSPGRDYALAGEVDDSCGNRARFLLRFTGWNDRAPSLRVSEVQTGKNSSKTKPHRDFIEFEALATGNIGGEEVSWASTVKTMTYRFPAAEVRKGDFVVLHLAPELLPEEVDEVGSDTAVSGGVDATSSGREFWCAALALPDECGAISISLRPGEAPMDGLFYAADDRSGALADDNLAAIASVLVQSGAWRSSGDKLGWEDAYRWNPSPSRSICRKAGAAVGPSGWYICASGYQSPGEPNGGLEVSGSILAGSRMNPKAASKKPPAKPAVKKR